MIEQSSMAFKSECFKHEEEVRVVLIVPKESDCFKVQYQISNGYIKPFIECSFPIEIVKSIMIGPLIEDEIAEAGLRTFLDRNMFNSVNIEKSKIPIRF